MAEVSFEVEDKEDEAGEEDDFEIFSHRIGSLPSLRSPSSLTNQDLYICSIPFFVEVSEAWFCFDWREGRGFSLESNSIECVFIRRLGFFSI